MSAEYTPPIPEEEPLNIPEQTEDIPAEGSAPSPSEAQEQADESTPPAVEQASPTDYAKMAADDLAEIKRLDAAYAPAKHLGDLPFAMRFAELRDMGLSVREALAAAAPRFDRADGRAHLRAVAPHGAKAAPEGLAGEEMKNARTLFYGLSDSEINTLYRRVTQRHGD